MWKTCTIVSNSMLKWLYFYSVVVYCFKLLSRWEISTSICQNVLTFIVIKLRPRGHKSACCSCEKSTDHCMTDARKYCRMSYLLMLSKAESEKWSWIHIHNRINTKTWSLPEGYTLPKFDRHLSLRSWVILWTHTHTQVITIPAVPLHKGMPAVKVLLFSVVIFKVLIKEHRQLLKSKSI